MIVKQPSEDDLMALCYQEIWRFEDACEILGDDLAMREMRGFIKATTGHTQIITANLNELKAIISWCDRYCLHNPSLDVYTKEH